MEKSWWIIGFCGVITTVYISTLSPSIAGGDSGEIVAEGCILGTAHPPGYPLLTLIIYLISSSSSLIQYGTVAFRVNFVSALFTTIACWCLGSTVQLLSESLHFVSSQSGAIYSMGMFAFSPLIWQYAVTAEVFPLNTMFAGILIYLTVLFTKHQDSKVSLLGSFICGLALGNQHTIILFEFPLILWILFLQRKKFWSDPMQLIYHGLFFVFGFSIYLYLPIAEILNPQAGSWGHVSSISGFIHHFLRKDYGTFQLFSGNRGRKAEGFSERTISYFLDIWSNQGYYHAAMLAFVGVTKSCSLFFLPKVNVKKEQKKKIFEKKRKSNDTEGPNPALNETSEAPVDQLNERVSLIILLTLVFYFLVFHSLSNLPLDDPLLFGVHQRFWMQPNIIFFLFAGLGFNFILSHAVEFKVPTSSSHLRSLIFNSLPILIALVAIYLQYKKWFFLSDQSESYHFQNYATALLAPLPPNSLLLINYDMQWTSVRYMQKCEGLRPDVTVINLSMMTYSWFQYKTHLYPNISFPGGYHSHQDSSLVKSNQAFTLFQFISANIDKFPIFLSGKMSYRDTSFEQSYEHVPLGLVSRIYPKSQVPDGITYALDAITSWESVKSLIVNFPPEERFSEFTWEWTIGRDSKDRLTDTAAFFLESALTVSAKDYKPLVYAVYFLETAIFYEGGVNSNSSHGPSTALLKNTGLAHVNLIQNKLISKTLSNALPLPNNKDIFSSASEIHWPSSTSSWKLWSTERFLLTWGEFLRRPDAKLDPQYQIIANMYEKAVSKK